MKEFEGKMFCDDLIKARGAKTQDSFAQELCINRSTLSLLENGKQIPSLEILSKLCELNSKSIDNYFVEKNSDSLFYLMGSLDENDKIIIEKLIEKIRVKEKYELLARRGKYVINR